MQSLDNLAGSRAYRSNIPTAQQLYANNAVDVATRLDDG
jgi:hypothetical protein